MQLKFRFTFTISIFGSTDNVLLHLLQELKEVQGLLIDTIVALISYNDKEERFGVRSSLELNWDSKCKILFGLFRRTWPGRWMPQAIWSAAQQKEDESVDGRQIVFRSSSTGTGRHDLRWVRPHRKKGQQGQGRRTGNHAGSGRCIDSRRAAFPSSNSEIGQTVHFWR